MRFNFNRQFNSASLVFRLRVFAIAASTMRIADQHYDWSASSLSACNVVPDLEG